MPRIYYNSLTATLFLPVLTFAALALLGIIFYIAIESRLGATTAKILLLPFTLLGLWLTEGGWFPLTCRRFAKTDARTLTLYGAFGRIRYQCPIQTHRFDLVRNINEPQYLRIETPDKRVRRFLLAFCRDTHSLSQALNPPDDGFEPFLRTLAQSENPLDRQFLARLQSADLSPTVRSTRQPSAIRNAYNIVAALPLLIGIPEFLFHAFWHLRVLSAAWHWGILIGVIVILPLAILERNSLRHVGWLKLPGKNQPANLCAEIRYALNYGLLMLILAALYGVFAAYNLALFSLMGKPWQSISTDIRPYGTCHVARAYSTWKLSVRLPDEYRRFNGAWCSEFSDDYPPPHGIHTVYFRESALGRELRFDAP